MKLKPKVEVVCKTRHITGGEIIKNTSCFNYPPVLPK